MADFPTRLDLFARGRDYVVQRAVKIDPAQVDVVGSDVNIYVGSASHVAYALVLQLAYAVNRLLLDGAEREDLDRYAYDRYQLARKGASPALGTVTFTRTGVAAGSVASGTRLRTPSGVEYITTSTVTFTASDSTKPGSVRAVQAGKLTQVGKNQIQFFANKAAIFDSTMTVNNDNPSAGGEDVEDDDTFRERIRGFWTTARRGTLGAIEYGALQVPGVVSAQASESLTYNGDPARVVNLYIADSSGVASDALAQLVRSNLFDFRAAGIAVIVYNSLPQIINVTLTLKFNAGTDTDTLSELIRVAIVEYINSLPVNATLSKGALYSVLQRFVPDGLIVSDTSIVQPTGDLVPDVGTTLRATLTSVILS
jgi:uncharacterized phage protein gp47/JayE